MPQHFAAESKRSHRITKHDLYRYSRLIHGWLSALAFIVLCLFAVTGLFLNHPEWLGAAPQPIQSEFTLTPADVARLRSATDAPQLLVAVAARHAELRGALDKDAPGDLVGDELFVRMRGVRGSSVLRADLATGAVEVAVEPAGALSILNELHRAERAGKGWRSAVDVIAVLLIVLSIIGYLIFLSMRGKRVRTAIALTLGSTLGLYVLFVFAVS